MRFLVLVLLLGAGCAAPPRAEGLAGISGSGRLLRLEPVAQAGGSDGALACLTALLRFHGREVDDEATARFGRGDEVSWRELRDYLRGRGFRAEVARGTGATGLAPVVALSLPVIVALDVPGSKRHFVVVHGFDPIERRVFVQDPLLGASALGFDELDREWSVRIMLVAAPRS